MYEIWLSNWVIVAMLALNVAAAVLATYLGIRTRHDVVEVKKSTDGLTDALVKSSRQEGYNKARIEGEDRATVLAEGQRQGREENRAPKRVPRKGKA